MLIINFISLIAVIKDIYDGKGLVQILVSNGAKVNIQDYEGTTPLHDGKLKLKFCLNK